jgi:hypothetical protein
MAVTSLAMSLSFHLLAYQKCAKENRSIRVFEGRGAGDDEPTCRLEHERRRCTSIPRSPASLGLHRAELEDSTASFFMKT